MHLRLIIFAAKKSNRNTGTEFEASQQYPTLKNIILTFKTLKKNFVAHKKTFYLSH